MKQISMNSLKKVHDWQQELQNGYTNPATLLDAVGLSDLKLKVGEAAHQQFAMRVPKEFAEKIEYGNPADPILKQVLPVDEESLVIDGYSNDPLEELDVSHDGLLHKYPTRVLWLIAGACAINCRYCFRRNFPYHDHLASKKQWLQAKAYIELNPEINEIILSGGDPLVVKDSYLIALFEFISDIQQIKRIRIHSRIPVVLPSRITSELCELFRQSDLQIVIVVHANHPNELCQDTAYAFSKLNAVCNAVLNQSVILKGINDNSVVLARLSETLFEQQVMPYYLHVLDKVKGAAHFDLSTQKIEMIYAELQKKLPGFLLPKLVKEIPNRQHKTLMTSDAGNY
jgi:L-lysine 2,3-aminomutase